MTEPEPTPTVGRWKSTYWLCTDCPTGYDRNMAHWTECPHLRLVNPNAEEKPLMAESLGWVWVLSLAVLIYASHVTRHRHALH